MTLEEQNELIKANLPNMSEMQIRNLLHQFNSYNANTMDAYKDIIEALENELMNRS